MKRWMTKLLLLGLLLGISRGHVAIWKDEDPQPWLVTEMPASLLPEKDRKALEKGIEIPDDYPLARVLEDYCS